MTSNFGCLLAGMLNSVFTLCCACVSEGGSVPSVCLELVVLVVLDSFVLISLVRSLFLFNNCLMLRITGSLCVPAEPRILQP